MPLSLLNEASCRSELDTFLLPFWQERMVDLRHGGLLSRMSAEGTIMMGEKYEAMHAAVLYIFSSAFLRLGGDSKRAFATQMYEYIVGHFWDEDFGGVMWSLTETGQRKNPEKHLSAQALTLLAFSTYYKTTRDRQALSLSKELFELIEDHCFDHDASYIERFQHDWTGVMPPLGQTKSLKNELLLVTAYTSLFKIWPDNKLRQRLMQLVRSMVRQSLLREKQSNTFVNGFGHLQTRYSYLGHGAETSWLLHDTASALQNGELLSIAEKLSQATAKIILDGQHADGGIGDHPKRRGEAPPLRSAWTQAQALVLLINTWIITGDDYYRHRAEKVWQFVQLHLRDRGSSLWRPHSGVVAPDDLVSVDHFGYHASRAMLELMDRFTITQTQSR